MKEPWDQHFRQRKQQTCFRTSREASVAGMRAKWKEMGLERLARSWDHGECHSWTFL